MPLSPRSEGGNALGPGVAGVPGGDAARLGRAADFGAAASALEAYANDGVLRGRRIDVVKQKVVTVGTPRIRGGVAGPTTLEFPRHGDPTYPLRALLSPGQHPIPI